MSKNKNSLQKEDGKYNKIKHNDNEEKRSLEINNQIIKVEKYKLDDVDETK